MSGVEEFMKKQEEKKAEVQAYRLAGILNDLGDIYHPTLKWEVGGTKNNIMFYLRERHAGIFEDAYDGHNYSSERRQKMEFGPEGQNLKKIISNTLAVDVSEGNLAHNVVFKFGLSKDADIGATVNRAEAYYAKALEKGFEKDFGDYFDTDKQQYESTKRASKEYALLTAKKSR